MPDVQPPDTAQLRLWLYATAQQDAAAFRHLYDATAARLYAYALRILTRRELAEDALQDSFVAIWSHAGSYQGHLAAPMTWMTAIVRNKALDLLERRGVREIGADPFDAEVMESLRDPRATPIDSLLLSREAKTLAHCMSMLEGLHRQVVGLAFFHDLSHSQLAQELALPIGTVKTWIRRSLDKLKSCLEKGDHR